MQTTIVPLVRLVNYSPRKMLEGYHSKFPNKKEKLSHVTLHTYVQMTKQPPAVQTCTLHHRAYHSDTWRCFSTWLEQVHAKCCLVQFVHKIYLSTPWNVRHNVNSCQQELNQLGTYSQPNSTRRFHGHPSQPGITLFHGHPSHPGITLFHGHPSQPGITLFLPVECSSVSSCG